MDIAQTEYNVEYIGKGILWPFGLCLYEHCTLQCFTTTHCLFWLTWYLPYPHLIYKQQCCVWHLMFLKIDRVISCAGVFSIHRGVRFSQTFIGKSFRCWDHLCFNYCLVLLLIITFTYSFVWLPGVFQPSMFIKITVT